MQNCSPWVMLRLGDGWIDASPLVLQFDDDHHTFDEDAKPGRVGLQASLSAVELTVPLRDSLTDFMRMVLLQIMDSIPQVDRGQV